MWRRVGEITVASDSEKSYALWKKGPADSSETSITLYHTTSRRIADERAFRKYSIKFVTNM
jgi:hypothetical protein